MNSTLTPILFPIMYQGYHSLDNREVNYFALQKEEALSYGPNVRIVLPDIKNPLLKRSEEYWFLTSRFEELTGKSVDVLNNSEAGLKIQAEFFEFLKERKYDGISFVHQGTTFYPQIDSQYVIAFNSSGFRVLGVEDLEGMAGWILKQMSKRSVDDRTNRLWVHNLKEIFENIPESSDMKAPVGDKLIELNYFGSDIPIEFYHAKIRVAVPCSGKTIAGNKCARHTKNGNGLCWQHSKLIN